MTRALKSTTVLRRVATTVAFAFLFASWAAAQDTESEPDNSDRPASAEAVEPATDSGTESTPLPKSSTRPNSFDSGDSSEEGGGGLGVGSDPDESAPGRALPDVYLLPDAEGRLQTVLGFSYEDFLEAWRQKQAASEPVRKPRFTLSSLRIDGQVTQTDRVEMAIRVEVTLHTDEQVEIPLGLGNVILLEAKIEGGQPLGFIHFDETNRRYSAWMKGKSGDRRSIELKAIGRLETNGRSTRLAMTLPRATVSSLELLVPGDVAEARSNRGTVALSDQREGTTTINVQGAAADFSLDWSSHRIASYSPSVLQATGAILTTIDGRGIVSDARLTLESLAGSVDRCRVQLPAGARLRSVSEGDFTWELLEANRSSGAVVEFRFRLPQKDPIALQLITEQPLPTNDADRFAEIGGFSVVGAVRQFGHVGLRVNRQWRLEWKTGDAVRQSANLPESLNRYLLAAGFEYSRRHWSLGVKVAPRPSRINVSADQLLIVDRESLYWQGKLNYSSQGNSLFAIRLAMPGWNIVPEEIEPSSKVDAAGTITTNDGVVTIPLREPVDGNLLVTIAARRHQTSPGNLDVLLPEIRQAALASGSLTVVAPSHLAIEPNNQACRGLERLPEPKDVALPVRVWGPRFLAYRTYLPAPRFVAAVSLRSQRVKVETTNRMVLHTDRAEVEQNFRWSIQNVPTERLEFDVPQKWLSSVGKRPMEATLDGQTVFLEPVSVTPGTVSAAPTSRLEIRLPEPRLGRIDVTFRSQTRYTLDPNQSDQTVDFPFALPVTVNQPRSKTVVLPAPSSGIAFALAANQIGDDNRWKPTHRTVGGDQEGGKVFEAIGRPGDLPLSVRLRPAVSLPDVIVHRAWFQTISLGEVERTRLACQIQTSRTTIGIRFAEPNEFDVEEILLDGQIVRFLPGKNGFLRIPVGKEDRSEIHRLELTVRRSTPPQPDQQIELPPIEFDGVAAFRRVYWQIVVPSHTHLLDSPEGWTSEFTWRFRQGYAERVSVLDESDLASWIGNSKEPSPAAATNTYLLGAFDLPRDHHAATIRRSTLLFWASGGSLGIGLLLLYFPSMRRTGLLLFFATLLSAVAIGFPDAAILIVQAASLGLLLSALAVVLRHRLGERSQLPSDRQGSESTASQIRAASSPLLRPTLVGGSSSQAASPQASPRQAAPTVSIQPHASDR